MNVYQKPEVEIDLWTEADALLQIVKASKGVTSIIRLDRDSAVDPWDPNAGLSEYNNIWDDAEDDDSNKSWGKK